ncbi:MAG: 2-oxoglutarate dehydrogenase E1 component [Desulfotignum sp.]|nr:2-oxoglutarate dehydrogenase E1 component [Desulfotignum sp.]MCF8126737.1 2-oxoglutarate dehydrogenase E1 component [Desulfotignum sp.]
MATSDMWNAQYIEAQYKKWKDDPSTVTRDWQFFFKGFEIGDKRPAEDETAGTPDAALQQSRVESLIYRYRDLGHLMACMDPLSSCPTDHPLLNLGAFGLSPDQLDTFFYTRRFSDSGQARLKDIISHLTETYCRSIGVEYMHLQDPAERRWLQKRMEPVKNRPEFSAGEKTVVLEKLTRTGLFERFLNKKYPGQTRFSLEGAEVIVPMLRTLFKQVSNAGCREVILGMTHRGRLSVQTQVLERPYEDIFKAFESCYDPADIIGAGDVKYHNGYLADIEITGGKKLRVCLLDNPSHLESVGPVVQGFARARQEMAGTEGINQVLPLLLHGDAAFAGQGIVAETLNMSQLSGFHTGGTIHVIINNQIGYTTAPENARSSRYSTDMAKMLMVPVFHVHGEDPEAALHVVQLAAAYRNNFHKDVVIDVVCYRRFGHNEGDEPYFTQPQMYERIRSRTPLDRAYADRLISGKIISSKKPEEISASATQEMETAFAGVRGSTCSFPEHRFYPEWDGISGSYSHEKADTAVERSKLAAFSRKLYQVPQGFAIYDKLARVLEKRLDTVVKGKDIDWGTAEALAFASLLSQGIPIRLSGQDSGRGTFSQRHSVIRDITNGELWIPLNHIARDQAEYRVYDSFLSEAGVLGFEYGYAVARPDVLTLWEAQFGDFVNNAQAVVDLYIAGGESKWQRLNGLVLLLPHGYEGLGPEHSSARPERFLQLCANDNLQVCNPTTPAQYFHLLRRQMVRSFRKPLVILTPKSLLRHPMAVSTLEELTSGSFGEILDDPEKNKTPDRVVLCSGKIYYDLLQQRSESAQDRIAVVRIEQFYPFPEQLLKKTIARYKDTRQWYWVQEEPANMGGADFIRPRLEKLVGGSVHCVARPAQASPATGFSGVHKQEQAAIIKQALTL